MRVVAKLSIDTSFLTGKIIGYSGSLVNEPVLGSPGSDAQRLLRIEEEAPLKDQKIALPEQRV
jgi:hypothetical protein